MTHVLGGDRDRGNDTAWRLWVGCFTRLPTRGMLLGRLRQRLFGIDPQHMALFGERIRLVIGQQLALMLLETSDAVFVLRIDAEGVSEPGRQPFLLRRTVGQFIAVPGQCMGLFQRILEL
ncbi:hypothetical protein, partial [Xanthomonas albilineans]|uniref:hypothetical protein n=1 Tax=Xanthomonas albilineans TaxID=29447 RepID=UPI001E45B18A